MSSTSSLVRRSPSTSASRNIVRKSSGVLAALVDGLLQDGVDLLRRSTDAAWRSSGVDRRGG